MAIWANMVSNDTERLLVLAREGDVSAQHQLLVHYRSRLRRMIAAYLDPQLASRLDPSDVLQEALTCAAIRLPKYLTETPIAFYPWLRQIVREQLIVAYRKHVQARCRSALREQPLYFEFSEESTQHLANQLAGRDSSPSQKASLREMQRRVRTALAKLEESDRDLVMMRFVEQLKIAEIADALEIPESTAKSRLARVLGKLSQLVTKHE